MPLTSKRQANDLFDRYANLSPQEFAETTALIWTVMARNLEEPMLAKGANQFFHIARRVMDNVSDEKQEA